MKNNSAYSTLADWFEYLNDDCDYENWSQYLLMRIQENLGSNKVTAGLDVGCGSGYFTRVFTKFGYTMTGVDVSVEMLDKARSLSLQAGVNCEYLLGDITKFKTPKKYGFVTAINDCFNYVPKAKLLTAFKRVRDCLTKDGLFIFDISSEGKFLKKIANTVSVDDRDDVTYLSFNSVKGDEVTMDVTLFIKKERTLYDRFDERHTQYIYRETEILNALESAGFTLLKVEGIYGEDKSCSDRLCFFAKRK
ncbi:MAG: class I SAM-dependent methyltransferase [Clostridia bacterium]|nr:class I SAM-dependent methyltransferase [Clostridia bacterium]